MCGKNSGDVEASYRYIEAKLNYVDPDKKKSNSPKSVGTGAIFR
jgi:hypothetical protein